MSKLAQFIEAHFPALTSNSYDNSNNIKLDLNVSTGQSILVQITRAFSFSSQIRLIASFFQVFGSAFF